MFSEIQGKMVELRNKFDLDHISVSVTSNWSLSFHIAYWGTWGKGSTYPKKQMRVKISDISNWESQLEKAIQKRKEAVLSHSR